MFPSDYKKNVNSQEEAARIEELKKKLYSASSKDSAVRERGLRQHNVDVGKNWGETDAKQARIEEIREKTREEAKLGLASENSFHHGSTLYGHFSPAEDVTKKQQQINTSFKPTQHEAPTPDGEETIGSFLSDKFAVKRAHNTEKKLAATDVTLRYASAQIEREMYPGIAKKKPGEPAVVVTGTAPEKPIVEENRYHPDYNVLTVGNTHLDKMTREVRHTGEKTVELSKRDKKEKTLTEEITVEQKKRWGFGIMFFVTVIIFFLSALGYAYYSLVTGKNTISPDKVEIVVTGPLSVRSGEVNDFSIDITNNNPTDLTLSDLVIQYPQGTMSSIDPSLSRMYERIEVGTIKPGETVRRKASAIFFGEENVKKNITYALEFSIPDSASIFNVTKDVGIVIAGSPVTAKITNIKEVTNNQELSFDIEIQSNTQEVVKNIQLQVEYPFGYKLEQSNIKPVFDNNTWNIGDLAALDSKTISLKGKLIGTSNLEKNFRFILGVYDSKTGEMSTVLSTQDQKVTIEKPFVSTKLSLDGLVQEFKPVQYEDSIQGDIVFTNNLNVPITDAVVEMSIGGVLIDRMSVKANNGFYRSSDDLVFWDKAQEAKLASIDPGESRELNFNMMVIKSRQSLIDTLRRAGSTLTVTIKAKRLNENRVPEEVTSVIKQELRLETDPTFEAGIAHKYGPFTNTGAFPPKVNAETTYTFLARITNTANTLRQTTFSAKLPPNAVWKNVYSKDIPASTVSYSQSKREITIQLGDINAGTGIDSAPRDFFFQLGFTPTLPELGKAPTIILSPRISGVDVFTNRRIDRGIDGLNIIPTADIGNVGKGSVVE
ncbi:MAG: hypothetical protein V4686_02585 [Patescibacteria group bacterium]